MPRTSKPVVISAVTMVPAAYPRAFHRSSPAHQLLPPPHARPHPDILSYCQLACRCGLEHGRVAWKHVIASTVSSELTLEPSPADGQPLREHLAERATVA